MTAVPGISETKARAVQEYLAQFPEAAFAEPPPSAEPQAKEETAADAAQQARALLIESDAPWRFRPRLLRELTRFAHYAWELDTGVRVPVTEKDKQRVGRRLERAQEMLQQAASQSELDRKAQTMLADCLAEASDRIAVLPRSEAASSSPQGGATAEERVLHDGTV